MTVSSITLPARYRLVRTLGTGGMGAVYEAVDTTTGEHVALKTMHRVDADAALRMKREFRSLSDIQHPNLVRLGELSQHEERLCFTMELLDGVDLRTHVQVSSPEERDERIRDAFTQLAEGVCALHGAGVVHRDIKPSNVLVTAEGRVVLVDFGIAEAVSGPGDTWTDSMITGTAHYMAPEQAAGERVGPAADWYSIGVMLYEVLTGQLPFEGPPLHVLQEKQLYEAPPPGSVRPEVSADFAELCADLVRREPRERLSGMAVLERLGKARLSSALSALPPRRERADDGASSGVGFVGRAADLDVLDAAFQETLDGRPATVLVRGPSGIGKSALVRRFLARARTATREGAAPLVLEGRCYERDTVPFNAIDPVVDALTSRLSHMDPLDAALLLPRDVAALARVFPVLRRIPAAGRATMDAAVDGPEVRLRAFRALAELLERLRAARPVIVTIDDLHWADPDSVVLLNELLQSPGAPAILHVMTARGDALDARPDLDALIAAAPATRTIRLEGLPPDDARELATRVLRTLRHDAASAPSIARETTGHPAFIFELAQRALDRGGPGAAPRLDDVLWSRVSALDEPLRRLVELSAVAGAPVPRAIAATAAGLSAEQLRHTLTTLRAERLLRAHGPRGDRVDTYHDRVREAVCARLTPEARAELYARLAAAVDASPDDAAQPEAHVRWLEGSGELERAARLAVEAARRAAEGLAFDRAAELYAQALRVGTFGAGRCRDAALEYTAACAGAPADMQITLHRRAITEHLRGGYIDDGLDLLHVVLRKLGVRVRLDGWLALFPLLWARLRLLLRGFGFRPAPDAAAAGTREHMLELWWSLAAAFSLTTSIRAAYFHSRACFLALEIGDPFRVARSLIMEAGFLLTRGTRRPPSAGATLELARQTGATVSDPERREWLAAHADFLEGLGMYERGQWGGAVEHVDRSEARLRERCVGVSWELSIAQSVGLAALAKMGDYREERRRFLRLRREALAQGNLLMETNLRTRAGPMLALLDDVPEAARRDVLDAIGAWSKRAYYLQTHYALSALAEIDLYTGDAAAAHRRIEAEWPALVRSFLLLRQTTRIEALDLRGRAALAHAAAAPDRRRASLRLAARCAARLDGEGAVHAAALAARIRAGAAHLDGDAARCVSMLRAAVSGFDTAQMAVLAAGVRCVLGDRIAGDEGAALRARGRAVLEQQGAKSIDRLLRVLAPAL